MCYQGDRVFNPQCQGNKALHTRMQPIHMCYQIFERCLPCCSIHGQTYLGGCLRAFENISSAAIPSTIVYFVYVVRVNSIYFVLYYGYHMDRVWSIPKSFAYDSSLTSFTISLSVQACTNSWATSGYPRWM